MYSKYANNSTFLFFFFKFISQHLTDVKCCEMNSEITDPLFLQGYVFRISEAQ